MATVNASLGMGRLTIAIKKVASTFQSIDRFPGLLRTRWFGPQIEKQRKVVLAVPEPTTEEGLAFAITTLESAQDALYRMARKYFNNSPIWFKQQLDAQTFHGVDESLFAAAQKAIQDVEDYVGEDIDLAKAVELYKAAYTAIFGLRAAHKALVDQRREEQRLADIAGVRRRQEEYGRQQAAKLARAGSVLKDFQAKLAPPPLTPASVV